MDGKNVSDKLNLISTSALGIAGALTGNPVLQACAYIPTIIYTIIVEIEKGHSKSEKKTLQKEITDLANDTWDMMKEKLPEEIKSDRNVCNYIQDKITQCVDDDFSFEYFIRTIGNDLKYLDSKELNIPDNIDLNITANLFNECFCRALNKYPDIESAFFLITLSDHDARIAEMEKQIRVLKLAHDGTGNGTAEYRTDIKLGTSLRELMKDDSDYYCNKFEEVLFLHQYSVNKISLRDVYVLPEAEIESDYRWLSLLEGRHNEENSGSKNKIYENVLDAIKDFLEYREKEYTEKVDFLFIEGKAAQGKSSLIASLCWNYSKRKEWLQQYIGERRLVVIKLRDMPDSVKGALNIEAPLSQIQTYLLNITEEKVMSGRGRNAELREFFRDTLLILEGFDELCMMRELLDEGKNKYFLNLWKKLDSLKCNCKVIVTSRPDYLKVEGLDFPKAHMTIRSFSYKKREEWISLYEKHEKIDNDVREILLKGNKPELEGIMDSPLTLYMIVARNIYITEHSSLWSIYHDIFSEEIYQRHYENGDPHPVFDYYHYLYRLTAEIANALTTEKHLSVTVERLLSVNSINDLLMKICREEEKGIQEVLKDCFGLASYFRISSKRDGENEGVMSAVEFYHNNIKDFFCCEYIWMQMTNIYENLPDEKSERDMYFLGSFQKLFQYIRLSDNLNDKQTKTVNFLVSKVAYLRDTGQKDLFIQRELKAGYFQHFFGEMLKTGFLAHYEYTGRDSIIRMMANVFSGVFTIYHAIYQEFGMYLRLSEVGQVALIRESFVFHSVFRIINVQDFSNVDFCGNLLSLIEFQGMNFYGASFINCTMCNCKFKKCDLRHADFSGALLQSSDFSTATIDETTLFSAETQFNLTVIRSNQLQYFEPWLEQKRAGGMSEAELDKYFCCID